MTMASGLLRPVGRRQLSDRLLKPGLLGESLGWCHDLQNSSAGGRAGPGQTRSESSDARPAAGRGRGRGQALTGLSIQPGALTCPGPLLVAIIVHIIETDAYVDCMRRLKTESIHQPVSHLTIIVKVHQDQLAAAKQDELDHHPALAHQDRYMPHPGEQFSASQRIQQPTPQCAAYVVN